MKPFAVPAVLLVGGLLAGCAGTGSVQSGPGGGDTRYVAGSGGTQVIKEREPAPRIQGTTIDGKPLKLSDFSGKVIVVNFWASWCGPCRAEAPAMQKVYEETKASGVQFVGIDVKDSRENAQAFVRTFAIGYPSLYDQPAQLALEFRNVPANAVPSTLIIDRHGKVAGRHIGPVTYSSLHDVVTKIAAER